MLEVKEKTIKVIEVEENFVFEIHEIEDGKDIEVEVWIFNKEYSTKIHAFSVMKSTISNTLNLYKHIEENKEEYINQYKEEVFE